VIFGCAALYPYPEERTGEMAALTVSPDHQSQGDGERLLKRIEARARAQGSAEHFCAHHPHHALVPQARLCAGQPRLAARGAQAQVQLGPRSQVLVKKLSDPARWRACCRTHCSADLILSSHKPVTRIVDTGECL
jgi:amino-acid N-acetyltransferase